MKALVVSTLALATFLATSTLASPPTTLKGYVVDQHCAKGMAQKANAMDRAAKHTKDCALMEACAASGFGIFADGKYTPFDEKGNATAKALIEKSKRSDGLYFKAVGTLAKGTLALTSLTEETVATMHTTPSKKD
jgi:hypothetical protein